jgi:hypothetical protein
VAEPAKVQTADLGTATKPEAVSSKATASNTTATQQTAAGSKATGANATADQNVFSKLLGNVGDKTIAGVIQGAASGYSSARQAAAAAESRKINPSTLRGYTYRATA